MYHILPMDIAWSSRKYMEYAEFLEFKNDPNCIIHYTDTFDEMLLTGILPDKFKNLQFSDEYFYVENNYFQYLNKKFNYVEHPWFCEIIDYISYCHDSFCYMFKDINQLFSSFLVKNTFAVNILNNISNYSVLISKNMLSYNFFIPSFMIKTSNISNNYFLEIFFYFDIFLLIFELLVLSFLFLQIKKHFLTSTISNNFYDDILNFFKLNGLSYVEITSVVTVFFFFIIGDIIMSFGDDCYFDNLFYSIIIFVVLSLFFLLIGLDIKYFFSMNSVSSNSMNLRTLIFDIFNNFISLLRIFLCWIRYIIYDIQVDIVDLNYFYLDFNNDLKFFFCIYSDFDIKKNYSLLNIFWNHAGFIFLTIVEVLFIFFQIVICVFKLFIAFYILWLVLDLFFFKILNHREIKKN